MSKTPRSDNNIAFIDYMTCGEQLVYTYASFSRQLETELANSEKKVFAYKTALEQSESELADARAEIERLKAPAMIADMREKMAALCHDQWAGWMEYLFLKSKQVDGCVIIPAWAVDRWRRQVATRYSDLSEDEKNSDRNEADRFLSLFNAEIERKDKLIEQMQEALKHVRQCSCSHMQRTTHDMIDAALSAAERLTHESINK